MLSLQTRRALVAVILLGAAPLALAAEPSLNAGDRELEIAASYTNSSPDVGDDFSILALDLKHGWFLTDQHEAGILFGYSRIDDGTTAFAFGTFGGFYDFNFPSSGNTVPVIGAAIGTAFGDAEGTFMEVSGGIRWFGSESVSVNTRAFYEIQDDDGFEIATLGLRLGLSWIIH